MADNEDLYPTATRLGRLDKARAPKQPKLDCVRIRFLNGGQLLYKYRFISSVTIGIKGEIVIECTCGHYSAIVLSGRNLEPMAEPLVLSTLAEIKEEDRLEYVKDWTPIVTNVELRPLDKHSPNAGNNNL